MKRPCFALSLLLASLAACLGFVSASDAGIAITEKPVSENSVVNDVSSEDPVARDALPRCPWGTCVDDYLADEPVEVVSNASQQVVDDVAASDKADEAPAECGWGHEECFEYEQYGCEQEELGDYEYGYGYEPFATDELADDELAADEQPADEQPADAVDEVPAQDVAPEVVAMETESEQDAAVALDPTDEAANEYGYEDGYGYEYHEADYDEYQYEDYYYDDYSYEYSDEYDSEAESDESQPAEETMANGADDTTATDEIVSDVEAIAPEEFVAEAEPAVDEVVEATEAAPQTAELQADVESPAVELPHANDEYNYYEDYRYYEEYDGYFSQEDTVEPTCPVVEDTAEGAIVEDTLVEEADAVTEEPADDIVEAEADMSLYMSDHDVDYDDAVYGPQVNEIDEDMPPMPPAELSLSIEDGIDSCDEDSLPCDEDLVLSEERILDEAAKVAELELNVATVDGIHPDVVATDDIVSDDELEAIFQDGVPMHEGTMSEYGSDYAEKYYGSLEEIAEESLENESPQPEALEDLEPASDVEEADGQATDIDESLERATHELSRFTADCCQRATDVARHVVQLTAGLGRSMVQVALKPGREVRK